MRRVKQDSALESSTLNDNNNDNDNDNVYDVVKCDYYLIWLIVLFPVTTFNNHTSNSNDDNNDNNNVLCVCVELVYYIMFILL